ncbi:hypothetical protein, partial [Aromatoleum aromaticum]|uniref:hypothetical protein n=1 Tax=Aromatoleum aromaticum TaxID=551760 RepID=UPI001459AB75
MKKVRLYACRQFDVTTLKWSTSRYKYTLDEIASFPYAEPIMDDWEDVERPDVDDLWQNSTGGLMRGLGDRGR